MSLTFSSKLGSYEIQSQLGSDGVGEVYRARGTRLDRTPVKGTFMAVSVKAGASFEAGTPADLFRPIVTKESQPQSSSLMIQRRRKLLINTQPTTAQSPMTVVSTGV